MVGLGRASQVTAALRGKMVGYGRKPWRLIALGNIKVDGVFEEKPKTVFS